MTHWSHCHIGGTDTDTLKWHTQWYGMVFQPVCLIMRLLLRAMGSQISKVLQLLWLLLMSLATSIVLRYVTSLNYFWTDKYLLIWKLKCAHKRHPWMKRTELTKQRGGGPVKYLQEADSRSFHRIARLRLLSLLLFIFSQKLRSSSQQNIRLTSRPCFSWKSFQVLTLRHRA